MTGGSGRLGPVYQPLTRYLQHIPGRPLGIGESAADGQLITRRSRRDLLELRAEPGGRTEEPHRLPGAVEAAVCFATCEAPRDRRLGGRPFLVTGGWPPPAPDHQICAITIIPPNAPDRHVGVRYPDSRIVSETGVGTVFTPGLASQTARGRRLRRMSCHRQSLMTADSSSSPRPPAMARFRMSFTNA